MTPVTLSVTPSREGSRTLTLRFPEPHAGLTHPHALVIRPASSLLKEGGEAVTVTVRPLPGTAGREGTVTAQGAAKTDCEAAQ